MKKLPELSQLILLAFLSSPSCSALFRCADPYCGSVSTDPDQCAMDYDYDGVPLTSSDGLGYCLENPSDQCG